ncbi:hypothetical protein N7474_001097 [Penicillium riverlandense]|uniref:uncharacterized protein n=1 Tax=Penicillium riverlandense TaxID=1903569 RepID=UPI002549272B|nr:uncharacterized protein N7474_001097 [Penicillium riverlandense]KAJ5832786.1 hypothetical protein N7474_001097 [Penicillium riverlandense]
MLPWSGRSTRTLWCAVRPLVCPAERSFTTTAALQRSKRKLNPKRITPDSTIKTPSPVSQAKESKPRADRQAIASAQDFELVVEKAVRDTEFKLREIKELPEGWDKLARTILNAAKLNEQKLGNNWGPLRRTKAVLQNAYLTEGVYGLRDELEYMAFANAITAKYSLPNLEGQQQVADLRYPAEWYPAARSMQRTIHLHVGPTNSGKTYHALQRLAQCKEGFYAGPLRLLAQEVYYRFKAEGISAGLVTGDEVKLPENEHPRIVSNTVEMVSLGQAYDVGVIDEIQMIADSSRGWAWTRAFLGAQVSELHLCGETRTVPLIRELCALTGDTLEIHRYERLNPLKVMDRSLQGDLHNLNKGDCVVSFSRIGIHALKNDIERITGRRAAIVYGGLPAEIRTQQASLFNSPDNDYDFLVASDAIGMGLNLSIKRIVFETLIKRIPGRFSRLSVPEIKQIGGRAGRYRVANASEDGDDEETSVGLVTSLEDVDLPWIQQAFKVESSPIKAAGILPPDGVNHKFNAYFPRDTPLEYSIKRLLEVAESNPLFFMCDIRSQIGVSQIIDTVPGLQVQDQLTFLAAPTDYREAESRDILVSMAECVAQSSHGRLLDLSTLNLEILEQGVSGAKEYLRELERLHKALILYLWLGYRFGGIFTDRTLATHVKGLVEERMMRALTEFSVNKKLRKDSSLKRQIALQKQQAEQEVILDSDLLQQGEDEHEISTLEGSPEAPGTAEESVEEGFLETTTPPEEAEPSKGTQTQTS